jgi:hypothetical protein
LCPGGERGIVGGPLIRISQALLGSSEFIEQLSPLPSMSSRAVTAYLCQGSIGGDFNRFEIRFRRI